MHITLSCHCGREMRPDGSRPAGHYICGCGWRVVAKRVNNGCVALRRGGFACFEKPVVVKPVGLCLKHLTMLVTNERPEFQRAVQNAAVMLSARHDQAMQEAQQALEKTARERERRERVNRIAAEIRSLVYYIRIGEYIKIGTSIRPKARIASYGVGELLAVEPGDRKIEEERLRQFAHLRAARREYFKPAEELMKHIKAVREEHGDPEVVMARKRVTLDMVAAGTDVPIRTLRRWVEEGRMTAEWANGRWLVDPLEVAELVEMRQAAGGRLTSSVNGRTFLYGRPH